MAKTTNTCSLDASGDEEAEPGPARRLTVTVEQEHPESPETMQLEPPCRILNVLQIRPPADCSLIYQHLRKQRNPPPSKKNPTSIIWFNSRQEHKQLGRCLSYVSAVVMGGHACRSSTRSWKSSHLRAASSSSRKRASRCSSVSTSSIWTWEEGGGEMNESGGRAARITADEQQCSTLHHPSAAF